MVFFNKREEYKMYDSVHI